MPEERVMQTYYAKSAFSDPVMIATFVMLVLQLGEVRDLMPEQWVHIATAAVAVLNLFLRVFNAQRPVAFIPPASVKPVEVKRLDTSRVVD